MLIVIDGNIGAGKTSLAKRLSKHLGTKAFLEPVSRNPILPLFYKGNRMVTDGKWHTNPYTFLLQIYYLNIRFRMIKQAMQNDNNVLDRSIYADELFMKMNYDMGTTTSAEWHLYESLLANMMEELPYAAHKKAPDLLIYLDVSLPLQLRHIKRRGRPYEQVSSNPKLLDYYKNLRRYYAKWYAGYNASPKMKINIGKYDFINSQHDKDALFERIDHALKRARNH